MSYGISIETIPADIELAGTDYLQTIFAEMEALQGLSETHDCHFDDYISWDVMDGEEPVFYDPAEIIPEIDKILELLKESPETDWEDFFSVGVEPFKEELAVLKFSLSDAARQKVQVALICA